MSLNFEQARAAMIEQQVRPWDVLDPRVLEALLHVHREDFVPPAHRQLAFADLQLPLAHGEFMLKPVVEGRLLQALALAPTDRVLEIGTGSGFLTACLASLCGEVVSVDLHADFTAAAGERLRAAGIRNASLATGDAVREWQPDGLFDAIVVGGAVFTVPPRFFSWLKPGGRLLAMRGQSPAQQAVLLSRQGTAELREESLFETDLPYLLHAEPPQHFVF